MCPLQHFSSGNKSRPYIVRNIHNKNVKLQIGAHLSSVSARCLFAVENQRNCLNIANKLIYCRYHCIGCLDIMTTKCEVILKLLLGASIGRFDSLLSRGSMENVLDHFLISKELDFWHAACF